MKKEKINEKIKITNCNYINCFNCNNHVLLILAGVSLSLVAGGNGIIGKAATAVSEMNETTAVEEVELVIAEANFERKAIMQQPHIIPKMEQNNL